MPHIRFTTLYLFCCYAFGYAIPNQPTLQTKRALQSPEVDNRDKAGVTSLLREMTLKNKAGKINSSVPFNHLEASSAGEGDKSIITFSNHAM